MNRFHSTKRAGWSLILSGLSLAISAHTWADCSYTITNNWGSGYTGEIKVTNNTNQTVNGWSVNWKDAGNITNSWNANLSGSNPYTATSLSWNGTLAPNASAVFGFQGTGSASVVAVNGSLCGVAVSSSSKSSTPVSSAAPSSKAASSALISSTPASSTPASSLATSSKAASSVPANASLILQEDQNGFCSVNGSIDNNNSGFTGSGFANTDNAQGKAIIWAVNASTSSRYTLIFRFANAGSSARNGSLLVNGGSNGNYTVELPTTGSWTSWQTVSIEVDLIQGNNLLKLAALTADGLPNMDSLTLVGAAATPGSCTATASSAPASSSSAPKSSSPSSIAITSSSKSSAASSSPVTSGCPVKLEGWATTGGGTTGGGNATPQNITTIEDFRKFAGDNTARTLHLSGTFTTGSTPVEIGSNKTIVGIGKNVLIKGGINISNKSNIIVRNLTITGPGKSGSPVDTIGARGSQNLWFDHLNLSDAPDGLLDLTRGSDHATVSWVKFSYTDPSHTHRLSLLMGGGSTHGDTDTGKNNHTVHHNWFGTLVNSRMPRLLFGKGHIYNNYFSASGNNYAVGSGSWASLLVENNYFKDVNNPHQFQDSNPSYITAQGNIYDNSGGKKDTGLGGSGSNPPAPFINPPYSYTLNNAQDIPALVQRCAGPQ